MHGLLHRISEHLDHLANMTHEVEHTIAEELAQDAKAQSANSLARLQNLDFLRQYAEDLALLTLHLSQLEQFDRISGAQAVNLSQRVRLERTRALLFPGAQPVALSCPSPDTGEVDLF
ncbi:hypothetical protein [Sulfitobacter sp. JB4-11]|uniref:hypothetical protein n=1 Tax=Sulfitobacter rhodophyticola TaxID=3238304 RepID=UPI0035155B59